MTRKVVIVTGSRKWTHHMVVHDALDHHRPTLVVHGGAAGADLMARNWALNNQCEYHCMPARWKAEGKSAGHRRNRRMLEAYPGELVLAFPEGEARGTNNCIQTALELGHTVWVYKSDGRYTVSGSGSGGE